MNSPRNVTLDCTPEPIEIDLDRTAVICIDMQNAFVREGGMFDLAGWPTAGARAVIEPDRKIIEAARAAGVKVVFVKMSFKPGLTNAGGPDSPSYHKEIGMVLMRKHPELVDKAIVQGTWGEEIIDELRAAARGARGLASSATAGSSGTDLDLVLKTLNIRYCAFIGGATNVCVGTTLMDAYSHDYWPILVKDAVFTQCPPVTVEATLWNVENLFGWVTTTEGLLAALNQ